MDKKYKKKKKKHKPIFLDSDSNFSIIEVVIIISIAIVFGIIIGYFITYNSSVLSFVRSNSGMKQVINTYQSIKDNYYKDISDDKLTEAAIKGMIEALEDPNSNYLNNSSTEEFNESLDGFYVGIGVTVSFEDEYNKIVVVEKNGPADKAGLKVNDIILEIDGKDCHNTYGVELTKLVKGSAGSKVKIKVKRDNDEKEFTVVREKVEIQNVSRKVFDDKIGYLKVNIFAKNIYKQFKSNLEKLEKDKIDSLIIDLRNNPGGSLSETKKILNLFFKKGTVLYQIEKKGTKKKYKDNTDVMRDYKIIILVNNNSASSSEVFSSCFKDNYKNAIIMGEKTYGKGTVQKSQLLASGSSIKYTVESWLTSKGKSINKVGISPDIEVEQNDEYFIVLNDENDIILQEALNKLKESNN